jgi:UDP-glucose 4-epimerase
MKIVITGVRGFIGSSLAKYLTRKGHEIIGLGRLPKDNGYGRLDIEGGQFVSNSPSFSDHLAGADAVVHLAAKQVDNLSEPLLDYIPSNIVLTEEICRSADPDRLKKVVFASSRLVYPGQTSNDVMETFQGNPDTTYGLSKKIGEEIIDFYAKKSKWTGISLRLGQVYGPDPRNRGVVSKFIRQALDHGQVTVFGQGVAVRDFIYFKDVIFAFESAILGDAPSGAYNIGSECGYSIKELAMAVSEVFIDRENSTHYKPVENEDLSRYVMDCSKALRYLKWKPQWSLKKAFQDMR